MRRAAMTDKALAAFNECKEAVPFDFERANTAILRLKDNLAFTAIPITVYEEALRVDEATTPTDVDILVRYRMAVTAIQQFIEELGQ